MTPCHSCRPGTPTGSPRRRRRRSRAAYGADPAAVGRAPGRVNLIGEHTDYNAGTCLPVALPHATYAAVAPRPDRLVRVRSAQADDGWEGVGIGPGEVTGWAAYVAGVAWALRESGVEVPGLDVCVDGTVPLGAGLSSSAALECSVAVAIASVVGLPDDEAARLAWVRPACAPRPRWPARRRAAWTRRWRCWPGRARRCSSTSSTTPPGRSRSPWATPAWSSSWSTPGSPTRSSTAATRVGAPTARPRAATLGVASLREATLDPVEAIADARIRRRARHVVTEIDRVARAVEAVERADWSALGDLFAASHASMRDDFEISCPELDVAVATAVAAGAVGARMTGGGFGGSAVALVPDDEVDAVSAAVDRAFDAHDFRRPGFLLAEPSAAASLC